MTKKNIREWLKAASIRAIKTIAQTAIALIPAGVTIAEVSWGIVISTSILAGLLSILTSLAGIPEAPKGK